MMYKNPGIAAVLSFLIPGLGQIYNGKFGKGLMHLIIVPFVISLALSGIPLLFCGVLFFFNIAFACYLAYYDAADYNASLEKRLREANGPTAP